MPHIYWYAYCTHRTQLRSDFIWLVVLLFFPSLSVRVTCQRQQIKINKQNTHLYKLNIWAELVLEKKKNTHYTHTQRALEKNLPMNKTIKFFDHCTRARTRNESTTQSSMIRKLDIVPIKWVQYEKKAHIVSGKSWTLWERMCTLCAWNIE